nr:hypothetical protein [Paenibacillus lutimineralis]
MLSLFLFYNNVCAANNEFRHPFPRKQDMDFIAAIRTIQLIINPVAAQYVLVLSDDFVDCIK